MKKQIMVLALASALMSSALPVYMPALAAEPEAMEEAASTTDSRPGTLITCDLTLDTKVNTENTTDEKVQYDAATDQYNLQIGGNLKLSLVWANYRLFKIAYLVKNDEESLRGKSLFGDYTYTFQVDPAVVSINPEILYNTDAWQQAFVDGSGSKATAFFNYMKCTKVTYDEKSGQVAVTFTIVDPDDNSKLLVPVSYIEDNAKTGGSQPEIIRSYSPYGAFYVTKDKFTNGTNVFPGEVEFSGKIDMSPWMSIAFPLIFKANTNSPDLTLVGKPDTPQQPDTPTPPKPGGGGSGSGSGGGTAVTKTVDLYRLYNPNSGEHFYTQNVAEKDHLVKVGWNYEGIGWTSPITSKYPVFRLYNPNAGDHHFTLDANERDELTKVGWQYEGISWYSLPAYQGIKVYREYNPNAKEAGAHNYTTNKVENDYLISIGWLDEGIGWWASAAGKPIK